MKNGKFAFMAGGNGIEASSVMVAEDTAKIPAVVSATIEGMCPKLFLERYVDHLAESGAVKNRKELTTAVGAIANMMLENSDCTKLDVRLILDKCNSTYVGNSNSSSEFAYNEFVSALSTRVETFESSFPEELTGSLKTMKTLTDQMKRCADQIGKLVGPVYRGKMDLLFKKYHKHLDDSFRV